MFTCQLSRLSRSLLPSRAFANQHFPFAQAPQINLHIKVNVGGFFRSSHGPDNKVVSGWAFSSLRNGPTGGCWWWQRGQQNWLLDGLVHRHKPQHSTKENTKVLEDHSLLVYKRSYRSGMCLFGKIHPKKCSKQTGKKHAGSRIQSSTNQTSQRNSKQFSTDTDTHHGSKPPFLNHHFNGPIFRMSSNDQMFVPEDMADKATKYSGKDSTSELVFASGRWFHLPIRNIRKKWWISPG